MPLLEIACFNAESALVAQASGADRIELCNDQQLGGITPKLSDFEALKPTVSIPVNVMIRPRGGGFIYTDEELVTMINDINVFDGAGVQGFVFGVLSEDHKVDIEKCQRLLEQANGKPCTFHRAFDEIREEDMVTELERLIQCGFKAVLTSGGKSNAVEGRAILRMLAETGRGRIKIIVGGGVRSSNINLLLSIGNGVCYHSSAILGGGNIANTREIEMLSRIIKD
jgi:copper homeostasis protein